MGRLAGFLPVPSTGAASGAASAGAAAAGAQVGAGAGARVCEACLGAHAGHYGSGRFCGVGCARRQGARRKWSVTPKARRAKRERAPCEACRRLHDRTYASGRFCSVNCARRQAASQKWSKSRAERSRRLDAIRPAAPPPPPQLPQLPHEQRTAAVGAPVYACPYAVVYGAPQPMLAPASRTPLRPATPIVYAPALAVPWAPAHAHPLAHAPLQLLVHATPRPTASVQLARRPVTPPSPARSRRAASPSGWAEHTREGDASEALLCLGGGAMRARE